MGGSVLARLIVISNRAIGPHERGGRAGGLAIALREALRQSGGVWLSWSGKISDTPAPPTITQVDNVTYVTRDLGQQDYNDFYLGFANGMLWPLCHYRPGQFDFNKTALEGYTRVNQLFAEALLPLLRPDDLIWVHDYHFLLMATALRRLGVINRIGFFLHIPFPVPEVLTVLPRHRRLFRDFLDYDLIGLQTEGDVHALSRYLREELNLKLSKEKFGITVQSTNTKIAAFPISIETNEFNRLAQRALRSAETKRLKENLRERRLIIGVDRIDYSKGLVERLHAFRELLEIHLEHRNRVTFLQVAVVSRGDISRYQSLRQELDALAGRINGQFADIDWTPVRYLNRTFTQATLGGFYRSSAVGLVTPVRDGMNLVAKEYVAAQDPEDPGVLVLSQFAGAARELTEALIVNPYDVEEVADALHRALTMPLAERRARHQASMAVLQNNSLAHWQASFLDALHGSIIQTVSTGSQVTETDNISTHQKPDQFLH